MSSLDDAPEAVPVAMVGTPLAADGTPAQGTPPLAMGTAVPVDIGVPVETALQVAAGAPRPRCGPLEEWSVGFCACNVGDFPCEWPVGCEDGEYCDYCSWDGGPLNDSDADPEDQEYYVGCDCECRACTSAGPAHGMGGHSHAAPPAAPPAEIAA
jgi:hypothetical protein